MLTLSAARSRKKKVCIVASALVLDGGITSQKLTRACYSVSAELSLPFAASEHFVAALAEVVFQQARESDAVPDDLSAPHRPDAVFPSRLYSFARKRSRKLCKVRAAGSSGFVSPVKILTRPRDLVDMRAA